MLRLDSPSSMLATVIEDSPFYEAEVAAAAFLARYSGRTLDAYRYDLRTFFQWAANAQLEVLEAKRPTSSCTALQWRSASSPLRLSTGDCRRSVASIALPTSTGGFRPIQPSTCGDRRSIPPRAEGSIAKSSGRFYTPQSDSTRTMPHSPCCSDSTASE